MFPLWSTKSEKSHVMSYVVVAVIYAQTNARLNEAGPPCIPGKGAGFSRCGRNCHHAVTLITTNKPKRDEIPWLTRGPRTVARHDQSCACTRRQRSDGSI